MTGAMLIRRILPLARAPVVMATNTVMVIVGAILLVVDIETSTAPLTVECLEEGLAICYQQVLAHYQDQDAVGKNKIEALQRHANSGTGSFMGDFTEHLGVLREIFVKYKPGELTDEDRTKVGIGVAWHTTMRLTPSEVTVLQVLQGKMVRLATDAEVPLTGYNTAGFYASSSYVGPRPELLPVEWANAFSTIFDSNAPTPVPLEAWQHMLAYLLTTSRVEEVKSAACIIVPVHHLNHYLFVVFFRQVKRVVFFDNGKRFNPSWPTQLMKDTFTEVGVHCFSDGDERWVFEEGTITQQPDVIHSADYVLSGTNALLQAEDV
ncbi:hypothetical protein V8C86DRAFT_2445851 [Haematococcus lacustris]